MYHVITWCGVKEKKINSRRGEQSAHPSECWGGVALSRLFITRRKKEAEDADIEDDIAIVSHSLFFLQEVLVVAVAQVVMLLQVPEPAASSSPSTFLLVDSQCVQRGWQMVGNCWQLCREEATVLRPLSRCQPRFVQQVPNRRNSFNGGLRERGHWERDLCVCVCVSPF